MSTSHEPIMRVAAPLRAELILQLRAAILGFEYQPGDRIVERTVCERYQVSRTVVREALRQLEAEGLVAIVPHRGPIVAVLSESDAVALFEVREELEGLAAKLFAKRATEEERQRLLESVDAVAVALEDGDLQRQLAAKDGFYAALFQGAHNDVIRSTVLGLHARVQLLRGISLQAPGRHPQSLAEIRQIAEFVIAGDAESAAEAARHHVRMSASVALVQMAKGGMVTS